MAAFRDNTAARRYERDAPEGASWADYKDMDGFRLILHVETPAPARGKGHAARLMEGIVTHARETHVKIKPVCSYAVAYFERTPSAGDVRA